MKILQFCWPETTKNDWLWQTITSLLFGEKIRKKPTVSKMHHAKTTELQHKTSHGLQSATQKEDRLTREQVASVTEGRSQDH